MVRCKLARASIREIPEFQIYLIWAQFFRSIFSDLMKKKTSRLLSHILSDDFFLKPIVFDILTFKNDDFPRPPVGITV